MDRALEALDGSNCTVAGDCICDTPPDPGALPTNTTIPVCIFNSATMAPPPLGEQIDLEDYNGITDLKNIMAYFHPSCDEMYFSDEQYHRMRNASVQLPHLQMASVDVTDLHITTNTTIDQYTSYFSNVIVDDGVTLTINHDISMAEGKSILVKNGGKLIVNDASISNYCGALWQGIIVDGAFFGDTPGRVELNNSTIENANVGIYVIDKPRSGPRVDYLAGQIQSINSYITDCNVGAYINRRGGYALYNCYFENTTFENSRYDLSIGSGKGVAVQSCTFLTSDIAIENLSEGAKILNNEFGPSVGTGYFSHANYPLAEGNLIQNNIFLSRDKGIEILGRNNYIETDIIGNTFTSSTALYVNGITQSTANGNSFLGNWEGSYYEHTGDNINNLIAFNLYSGNVMSASNLGENTTLYSANCFEYADNFNIEVNDQSSIAFDQGVEGGNEAGNCFDKSIPTMITGSGTESFTYHILESTTTSECEHPGDPGTNNWILSIDALDEFTGDCGAGILGNIPPNLFNCIIPGTLEARLEMRNDLLLQISAIKNDPNLSELVKKYLIQRLELCLRKIKGDIIQYYLHEEHNRDDAITFLQSSAYFEDKIMAYGLMIQKDSLTTANAYLNTITTENSDEQAFVESQLIFNQYLQSGLSVSASDLATVLSNAEARNPFACFSESIYYELTGERVDKPLLHLVNPVPRSKKDDPSKFEINIYPNPTNTPTINIHLSKSAIVELIGISGKIYQRASFDKGTHIIVLQNIGEAILLVKCTDNGGNSIVEKIVRI